MNFCPVHTYSHRTRLSIRIIFTIIVKAGHKEVCTLSFQVAFCIRRYKLLAVSTNKPIVPVSR